MASDMASGTRDAEAVVTVSAVVIWVDSDGLSRLAVGTLAGPVVEPSAGLRKLAPGKGMVGSGCAARGYAA